MAVAGRQGRGPQELIDPHPGLATLAQRAQQNVLLETEPAMERGDGGVTHYLGAAREVQLAIPQLAGFGRGRALGNCSCCQCCSGCCGCAGRSSSSGGGGVAGSGGCRGGGGGGKHLVRGWHELDAEQLPIVLQCAGVGEHGWAT